MHRVHSYGHYPILGTIVNTCMYGFTRTIHLARVAIEICWKNTKHGSEQNTGEWCCVISRNGSNGSMGLNWAYEYESILRTFLFRKVRVRAAASIFFFEDCQVYGVGKTLMRCRRNYCYSFQSMKYYRLLAQRFTNNMGKGLLDCIDWGESYTCLLAPHLSWTSTRVQFSM